MRTSEVALWEVIRTCRQGFHGRPECSYERDSESLAHAPFVNKHTKKIVAYELEGRPSVLHSSELYKINIWNLSYTDCGILL